MQAPGNPTRREAGCKNTRETNDVMFTHANRFAGVVVLGKSNLLANNVTPWTKSVTSSARHLSDGQAFFFFLIKVTWEVAPT